MKFSRKTSSKTRTNRRKYYKAESEKKRKMMSSGIEKIFRDNHNIKTMPLRKGDEVKIVRGNQKGKNGKIIQCSRKYGYIYINSVTYKKANGEEIYKPIHPSNVLIQKLVLTSERKETLNKKFFKKGSF